MPVNLDDPNDRGEAETPAERVAVWKQRQAHKAAKWEAGATGRAFRSLLVLLLMVAVALTVLRALWVFLVWIWS